MTALKLFLLISAGILLQFAVFAGMAFHRHWLVYQALKNRLANFEVGLPVEETPHNSMVTGAARHQEAGWIGAREFRVVKKEFEDANRSICSFYLVAVDGKPLPEFLPGQFLTLRLDLPDAISGKSHNVMRCYSLSDRPGLPYYRISIKRMPPPGIVSNTFHDQIHEGFLLQAHAPSGQFFLAEAQAPVVLIAGGIGITPLLSMIHTRLADHTSQEIWLFYGVRNGRERIMQEQLNTLEARHPNFHVRICYSQPLPHERPGQDFHHQGHVDITLLRLTLALKPYHFYVCGPPGMMASLIPDLEAWGVPDPHLHYETFGPASIARSAREQTLAAPAANRTAPITVTLSRSNQSWIWNESHNTLLQFAEGHGVALPSGCRSGVCGACQTRLQSGTVQYSKSPEFKPEPGHCLPCICHPQGDVTLLA